MIVTCHKTLNAAVKISPPWCEGPGCQDFRACWSCRLRAELLRTAPELRPAASDTPPRACPGCGTVAAGERKAARCRPVGNFGENPGREANPESAPPGCAAGSVRRRSWPDESSEAPTGLLSWRVLHSHFRLPAAPNLSPGQGSRRSRIPAL